MITQEEREQRRNFLGSSDMAALVGLDPFTSRSDVYLEKIGELEDADEEGLPLKIGKVFETAVIDLFAELQGKTIQRNVRFESGIYAVNTDGYEPIENENVEAKTTGKVEEWGDPWTNDVPEQHIIQCNIQMYCITMVTGRDCKKTFIPVLLPGHRSLQFRTYCVERNDNLINDLIAIGNAFWNDHVLPRVPPQPFEPREELIKRIRRIPNSIADIPDELITEWMTANQVRLAAEKAELSAKQRLLGALGTAEAGESQRGQFVTYFEQSRAGYEVKPSSFRVLRAPKGKQPKLLKGLNNA